MDLHLQGKTALITGGASGLGRETAHYMTREGVNLVLADRDSTGLAKVEAEVKELGGNVASIAGDVRKYGDCEAFVQKAVDTFGGLDICVASAGIVRNVFFLESGPDDWNDMIDINVRGMLNTVHAAAKVMAEQKTGSIVTLASEAAKTGEKRITVYSATKGAVASFAKAFSLEMGRFNVRVNAVCPAVTMTPMTLGGFDLEAQGIKPEDTPFYQASAKLYPLGRLGRPEDIASMITFLASDEASWVTGQCISVNGGFGRS